MIADSNVTIYKMKTSAYPIGNPTFRPSDRFPEYPFEEISKNDNEVYRAVRESLFLMGLDAEHYNTKNWNPFYELIKPGNIVLLKPNLVMDYNQNKKGGTECLYTQPSVVAAVVDFVSIALNGTGKIFIGDAPMQSCSFNNLLKESGYKELLDFYKKKGLQIEIVDFRELTSKKEYGILIPTINQNSKGTVVNLGEKSEFYGAKEDSSRYRITSYDPRILPIHHSGPTQEYYISNYLLSADVVINMPKPKTHRKAGITGALKNLVGINVRKEFLPHHTKGDSETGSGDEYKDKSILMSVLSNLCDFENLCIAKKNYACFYIAKIFEKCILYVIKSIWGKKEDVFVEGSWYGNHTISRTIADLNKILFYADKKGKIQDTIQRKSFIVADMVISGEQEGPVAPSPKKIGIIAAGSNPLYFDEVITTLMGFDINKIPTLNCLRNTKQLILSSEDVSSIILNSNVSEYAGKRISEIKRTDLFNFEPTLGWKGHIEL